MALKAYGAKLQYDEGGASFVDIPGVISVDGPSEKGGVHDATDLSTTGGAREYIEDGLADGGEVSTEIHYEPGSTVHEAIRAKVSGPKTDYKINYPNSTTAAFAAIVTAFDTNFAFDGKLLATITLKITGTVSVT